MRVMSLNRPWTVLPAMEPEASNTIIASSVQGIRPSSSACIAVDPASRAISRTAAGHA
jgi:hypothetical protein